MLGVLCFLCLVFRTYGGSVPFITPCKTGDNTCLLASARAAVPMFVRGVPELGLKSLDPLNIPLIVSDQNGLKLQFKNSTLTGLRGCKIENIKSDLTKMKQSITSKCNLVLSGDYKLKGQIIILPVEGNGKFKMDIRDIIVKVNVDIIPLTSSGATHWHISKWRQNYEVLTGATFNFENLFNGNKVLGDPVLEFVNTNWKDVMQEIAPPITQAIIAKIVEGVEAFYSALPVDQLVIQ